MYHSFLQTSTRLFIWKEQLKIAESAHLCEFLDVAEFQIGDDEEYEHHSSQSHMILPQTPGGVLYSQVVQILLSCAPETTPAIGLFSI